MYRVSFPFLIFWICTHVLSLTCSLLYWYGRVCELTFCPEINTLKPFTIDTIYINIYLYLYNNGSLGYHWRHKNNNQMLSSWGWWPVTANNPSNRRQSFQSPVYGSRHWQHAEETKKYHNKKFGHAHKDLGHQITRPVCPTRNEYTDLHIHKYGISK